MEDAEQFANSVGFPVLVRPSFVLSGAAMSVASTPMQLANSLRALKRYSEANFCSKWVVVLSKFYVNAKEIEFDAVAQNGKILNYAISEHIENAGVHSGDATLVIPAQKLYVQTVRHVKTIAGRIAAALNITGPFNIQLLAKGNAVKVIECNLRASRTFPFVSKALDINLIALATRAMMGYSCKPFQISLYGMVFINHIYIYIYIYEWVGVCECVNWCRELYAFHVVCSLFTDYEYVAVKAPIFSFTRLRGADPTLGVEMHSTGEVACFGTTVHEAFLQSLLASNFRLPKHGKFICFSVAEDRYHHIHTYPQLHK